MHGLKFFSVFGAMFLVWSCAQTEPLPQTGSNPEKQQPALEPERPALKVERKSNLPAALTKDYQIYQSHTGEKAFAVAKEPGAATHFTWAWSVGHRGRQLAEKSALSSCQTSVRNLGRRGQCFLFAVNNQQLKNL